MKPDHEEPTDWLETIVRLAGRLGLNEVRVRWRLIRLQQSYEHRKTSLVGLGGTTARRPRYEHAVCPRCGRIQDRDQRQCLNCGTRLSHRAGQAARRLGLVVPKAISVSSFIGLLLLIAHYRLMLTTPKGGYFSADVHAIVRLGGYWLPALQAGEYWRYATAVFLHFGLWHLGFNLLALAQIGPTIEDIWGRGRTAFLFMATGIVSFAACHVVQMAAPSAGASGAVCGLIGAAAGWGQRDGTRTGRAVRNQMVTWLVYTTLFGLAMNVNHIAHFAGFVSGGILGFATPPTWLRRDSSRSVDAVLGLIGIVSAIATTMLVVRPPNSRIWIPPVTANLVDQEEPQEPADDSADEIVPASLPTSHRGPREALSAAPPPESMDIEDAAPSP